MLENIALPLILMGEEFSNAKKKASFFLEMLNLEEKKNNKPGLLSGGEQQRGRYSSSIN